MYGYALVCGWGLSAAVIALVWANSRPGRSLLIAMLIGAVAGLLWPVTLWVAAAAWIYRRANRRAGATAPDPAVLDAQARQAEAFARQVKRPTPFSGQGVPRRRSERTANCLTLRASSA